MRRPAATVRDMDAWLKATAADLGRGIEAGKIDPVALTETYLAAIDEHPFSKRIYARLTKPRARAEAEAAADRARRGLRRSLLDGVPISWKDLFDTAGTVTEAGSAFLRGRVPEHDARVLANATEAGLVCLGKTHMTELAFSGLGLNPITESPPCVNDHDAVSGGSSSGAATSVAFGLAAAGIGSDTGGSVRLPSVWNDLVGLKTLWGRLPLDGVVPLCSRFDTVGPLCRSVEDAALLMSVMEAGTPPDLSGASLKGVRLGILRSQVFEGIENAPRVAFENAVMRLQSAGVVTTDLHLDIVEEATRLGPTLFPAEAYGTWKDQIDRQGDLMYPPIRTRFLQGTRIGAGDFVAAWRRLDQLRRDYHAATAEFDAVILPTSPILPPKAAPLLADEDAFTKGNLMALRNTRIGNMLGLAGVTLPTGVPSCGIMFQGASEERLLRVAVAAEAALS